MHDDPEERGFDPEDYRATVRFKGPKVPAGNLKKIPFPECASKCAAVEYLGCSECESVCPHKFKEEG